MASESVLYRLTLKRALANADYAKLPVHFEVAVLDRYRESPGFSIIRSNTVGRVRKQGGWSLDFGIADDESMVHLTLADLQNLPVDERDHWTGFATLLLSSEMYIQMRMSPGACYDDGEIRPW